MLIVIKVIAPETHDQEEPSYVPEPRTYETADDIDVVPGDYLIYETKGRRHKDGVWPRFEFVERRRVLPPEPAAPKTQILDSFLE